MCETTPPFITWAWDVQVAKAIDHTSTYFIYKSSTWLFGVPESFIIEAAPQFLEERLESASIHSLFTPYRTSLVFADSAIMTLTTPTNTDDLYPYRAILALRLEHGPVRKLRGFNSRAVDKISSLGVLIFLPFRRRQPLGA